MIRLTPRTGADMCRESLATVPGSGARALVCDRAGDRFYLAFDDGTLRTLSLKSGAKRPLPRPFVTAIWSNDGRAVYYAASLATDKVSFAPLPKLRWYRFPVAGGKASPTTLSDVKRGTFLRKLGAKDWGRALAGLGDSLSVTWGAGRFAVTGFSTSNGGSTGQDLFVTRNRSYVVERPNRTNLTADTTWINDRTLCYFGNVVFSRKQSDDVTNWLTFYDLMRHRSRSLALDWPEGPPALVFSLARKG